MRASISILALEIVHDLLRESRPDEENGSVAGQKNRSAVWYHGFIAAHIGADEAFARQMRLHQRNPRDRCAFLHNDLDRLRLRALKE